MKRLLLFLLGLFLLASCQTTPPAESLAAPTGLTTLAGNKQITLEWNAHSEANISHYTIYQGTNKNSLSKASEVLAGTEIYLVTGLSNDTTYFFAIEVEDKTGQVSARSQVVSATPLGHNDSTSVWDGSSWGNAIWGE